MSSDESRPFPPAYWRFFLPLAAVGVLMLSGRLFQNYALLEFPDGVSQLARFTLASSIFFPCMSAVAFFPQLTNALIRNQRDLKIVGRFAFWVASALTGVLFFFAWSSWGKSCVAWLYPGEPELTEDIIFYLKWYTPSVLSYGYVNFVSGLLMQCERTHWVTVLRVASLVPMVLILAAGVFLESDARWVIGWSCLVPEICAALLAFWLLKKRSKVGPVKAEDPRLSYANIARYYWSLALTTIMFTLSRPIVFQLVTWEGARRGDELWTETVLAALALSFGLSMIFQITINHLRNVYLTYAAEFPAATRRFAWKLIGWVTLLMAILIVTPGARFFFEHLQGADGQVLEWAVQSFAVFVLVPLVVGIRNHYHGLAMVERRTLVMGTASILRNVGIVVIGLSLSALGVFTPWTGSLLLIMGFVVEALVVGPVMARRKPSGVIPPPEMPVS
ncbi:MAG: hypothetical protein HRU10_08220 [Opitutales bacterium]|nr:hypothetical protein [Opitutales bacterium]